MGLRLRTFYPDSDSLWSADWSVRITARPVQVKVQLAPNPSLGARFIEFRRTRMFVL